ncbi:hypothetical protein IKG16_02390 [Candidatus Saccharibacteria bacterium]|nr:hypothetical protein [Candidatus Saccharibacteria bacterium]
MTSGKKRGIIIPNGVSLQKHENDTVIFLTELGHDIELIRKSNIKDIHTPDFWIDGKLKWEAKSPTGSGKYIFQNTIQQAVLQSENIVIDIRRMKLPQDKCIREFVKEFTLSKGAKRLKIIAKKRKSTLDYEK